MLVYGRADLSSPPDFAHRMHSAWPSSELVLLDAAEHGPGADATRVIVEATDRLRPIRKPDAPVGPELV